MGIAEQQGLPYCRAWVSYPLIGALLSLGQYAQAEQTAQRFVSEARAFADDLMVTQATAMLGHAQLATGQHDAARTTLQQGLAMAQRSGLRVIIPGCLVGLGNLELALGHPAAAQLLYEQTFAAAQPGTNETWKPPTALVGLGRIALSQRRPEDALAHFYQALNAPVRSAATTAEALVYAAEALAEQGDLALPAEVCGFLLSWPGAPYGVKEIAWRLVGAMEGRMLPVELAMASGQQQQLEDVVAQLVDHAAVSTARASSK
jgi:tetratricopeptide (TPR) repeat protein